MLFRAMVVMSVLMSSGVQAAMPLVTPFHVMNQARLQRGATYFMQYCSGCHTLRYLQYNEARVSLGLASSASSMTDTHALSPPVHISMPVDDAVHWFGQMPPDLSLIATVRGRRWLHTYLLSFYADAQQPYGANNVLLPDGKMPNPWIPLINAHDPHAPSLDDVVFDLVAFLTYVAEPSIPIRMKLGLGVVLFFFVLSMVLYGLKRSYWRQLGE